MFHVKHQVEKKAVSRETFDKVDELWQNNRRQLEQYIEKLFWWNEKVNLVSRDLKRNDLELHVKHSLLPLVLFDLQPGHQLLDAGTGGGLPGIPLAICVQGVSVDLNDISTKKILALKDIARKLSLSNVTCKSGDIASLKLDDYHTVISKHAFKIPDIANAVRQLNSYKIILYKGIDIEEELSQLDNPHNIQLYDLAAQSATPFYEGKCIVLITPKNQNE